MLAHTLRIPTHAPMQALKGIEDNRLAEQKQESKNKNVRARSLAAQRSK
eukprot:gene6415-4622_t